MESTDNGDTTELISYQSIDSGNERQVSPQDEQGIQNTVNSSADSAAARGTLVNFVLMSTCFSANHGCVVACLSLATARLGAVGAWQSGTLYLFYTGSGLIVSTYVVKRLGPRNALIAGMTLYCFYVGCFLLATVVPQLQVAAALQGAAIGGIGAGFLWTAQGSYFSRAAEEHARCLGRNDDGVSESNTYFATIFAFLYLIGEVALRSLSSLLLDLGFSWMSVFRSYTAVAVLATVLMSAARDYPTDDQQSNTSSSPQSSVWYKVTVAGRLLVLDPKMKYMIGLNAVFGFTSAFLNSYINGEVVRVALDDPNSKSVGLFNAWVSCVASAMSLVFARVSGNLGNGFVLVIGALCFFGVVFPFVIMPDSTQWNAPMLLVVYALHGTGRATFEATLKATFADFFAYEKEGAFANIILQNGLSGAIGFLLTFTLLCSEESRYCIHYHDGSLHDVLSFELLVTFTAAAAIIGYWRAASIRQEELLRTDTQEVEDEAMMPSLGEDGQHLD